MSDELVLLRNSERSTYRRCRQKWQWSYNERWSPPREKGALTFGTMCHGALEARYPPGRKRGPHPAKTFERLYAESGAKDFAQWDDEGNKVPALELGIAMMNGYVAQYGNDDHIEIIQPEVRIQIDVFSKDGKYLCTWVGSGDAIYKDLATSTRSHPSIKFLEHKTAKSIEEELRVNTGYGEQGLSYYWAGDLWAHHNDILLPEQSMDGVTFNWLKKALPDTRPQNAEGHRLNKPTKAALTEALAGVSIPRGATMETLENMLRQIGEDPAQYGEVSKRQPGHLFHRQFLPFGPGEMADINRRIRSEAQEMALVKAGRLPIYHNPTKDCSWECPFVDVCEVKAMGGDWRSILQLEFTQWDPYEDHELEEEKH